MPGKETYASRNLPLLGDLFSECTIVGFSGRARSGKDTAADYLVEHFGFTKLAFADPLKQGVNTMLGLPSRVPDEHKDRPLPFLPEVTLRQVYQKIGTEGARSLHPDFWVALLVRRMKEILENEGVFQFVISDVRFENEADLIRSLDGMLIRVEREEAKPPRSPWWKFWEVDEHISESGLTPCCTDLVVANNGTLEEFEGKIHRIAMDELNLAF